MKKQKYIAIIQTWDISDDSPEICEVLIFDHYIEKEEIISLFPEYRHDIISIVIGREIKENKK